MNPQTEWEIDNAIAEFGFDSEWKDLSPKAKKLVRKWLAEDAIQGVTPERGKVAGAMLRAAAVDPWP